MSKKRVSPIRNTFDDDMSFAELMGLKGMDDREAVKAFMAGVATKPLADNYVADQWRAIEAAERQRKINKARGQKGMSRRLDEAMVAVEEYKDLKGCFRADAIKAVCDDLDKARKKGEPPLNRETLAGLFKPSKRKVRGGTGLDN